jgi:hypothetical protein
MGDCVNYRSCTVKKTYDYVKVHAAESFVFIYILMTKESLSVLMLWLCYRILACVLGGHIGFVKKPLNELPSKELLCRKKSRQVNCKQFFTVVV